MAKKRRGGKTTGKAKRVYLGIGIVVVLVVAVLVVRHFRFGGRPAVEENYYRGAADAAVVLEEFSDFR